MAMVLNAKRTSKYTSTGYGSPCDATLELIGGKYKASILYYLRDQPKRYGTLRRLIPKASQRSLTQQLRQLEADGLVSRTVFPEAITRVEYALTHEGKTLIPLLKVICDWGKRKIAQYTKALKLKRKASRPL
jgi:DNA-binding HxlR family transcriptional regulator